MTESYKDVLAVANDYVRKMFEQDLGVEIAQKLLDNGFVSDRIGMCRLEENGVKLNYDVLAEEPFTIIFEEDVPENHLKAKTLLEGIIKEVLEDV